MYQSYPLRLRFFAFTLLALFTYNAIFGHITLWIWKAYMHEQLEEFAKTLDNDQLVHFVFPKSAGIEHEFESGGRMYDVIRYTEDETTLHYWCIQDFAESIIDTEHITGKLLSDAHRQWKGHLKNIGKKISQLFCHTADINETCSADKQPFVLSYYKQLSSKRVSVLSPPPWCQW